MAEVTIKILDNDDGSVEVVSTPSALAIAYKTHNGEKLTSGEAYALFALRAIANKSKEDTFEAPAGSGLVLPDDRGNGSRRIIKP